jgi:Leucine-rich repeat (LRR) protein
MATRSSAFITNLDYELPFEMLKIIPLTKLHKLYQLISANGGGDEAFRIYVTRRAEVLAVLKIEEIGKQYGPQLQLLSLSDNQIGDSGMQTLAAACGSGAMVNLIELDLKYNQIGDAGMAALSTALGNGALPQLQELFLDSNQIGDVGIQAFATACGSGALPQLTLLSLYGNQISDAGMAAFATAVGSGAMAKLTELYLGNNQIADAGMTALATAIGNGALPSLKTLVVDAGPLGTEHPALKNACGKRGIQIG